MTEEPKMRPLVRRMWQGQLINQLKAGEEFLQMSSYGIPEQQSAPIMDGDEAIAQIKTLMARHDSKKDLAALKIAIDAIDEVWNW